jgi:hypothetical protein
MAASVNALREHRIIVWAKHGVLARSDLSIKNAADRVGYAETAATYEYLDLAAGGQGQALSDTGDHHPSVPPSTFSTWDDLHCARRGLTDPRVVSTKPGAARRRQSNSRGWAGCWS